MKRLLLVLFLCFIACQQDCGPHTDWATNDTDAGEVVWRRLPVRWSFMCGTDPVPEFEQAADWWNQRLGNQVFERIPDEAACLCTDGGCPMALVMEGLTDFDPYDVPDSGIRSYARTYLLRTSTDIRAVVIRYYVPYWGASDEARVTIARHEMGHVLGLMHTNNERCLMYYTVDPDVTIPKSTCDSETDALMKHYKLTERFGGM